MQIRTGILALAITAGLGTLAMAQEYRPDDRSGGGFVDQGQSQSHGGGRYDPSTGGRFPPDDGAWRYQRMYDPWVESDYDRFQRYRTWEAGPSGQRR